MVPDKAQIRILRDGTAVPDPCTLSKSGNGFPKLAEWFAEDKEHDIHVVFDGPSPFKKERIIKNGGGGPEHTDDITDAQVRTYYYKGVPKGKEKEVAADPKIIIEP